MKKQDTIIKNSKIINKQLENALPYLPLEKINSIVTNRDCDLFRVYQIMETARTINGNLYGFAYAYSVGVMDGIRNERQRRRRSRREEATQEPPQ